MAFLESLLVYTDTYTNTDNKLLSWYTRKMHVKDLPLNFESVAFFRSRAVLSVRFFSFPRSNLVNVVFDVQDAVRKHSGGLSFSVGPLPSLHSAKVYIFFPFSTPRRSPFRPRLFIINACVCYVPTRNVYVWGIPRPACLYCKLPIRSYRRKAVHKRSLTAFTKADPLHHPVLLYLQHVQPFSVP